MSNAAPLEGIRVVECTNIVSGPFAGTMLGELGAEVIKVESLRKPDLFRNRAGGSDPYGVSGHFYAVNRGKRYVSIDATTPDGRAMLTRLASTADVFLHNMRPGKEVELGVGHDELAALNPRLIYAAISGLGADGAESSMPVYDYVVQARVGMVDYQRDLETNTASLVSQLVVDKSTSNAAVQAILAALFVRERTGRGQRIDIPMVGVGLSFGWPDVMSYFLSEVEPAIPFELLPSHIQRMPSAALLVLRTKDGEIVVSPALPPWDGLCIAFDRPEWVVDERYAEPMSRLMNFLQLKAELAEAAQQYTNAELLERLADNDVAAGAVCRRADLHNDPLLQARLIETDAAGLGRIRQPLPMWDFSDSPAIATTAVGRVGEDTVAVLTELGLSESEVAGLQATGAISWPDKI